MQKTERGPLTDRERLGAINELLQELDDLTSDHVLLIEGKNDRAALNALGIDGDMFQIQSEGGPVAAVEYVEAHGGKAVVLTDWDRRGNSLADQIRSMLGKDNSDIDFGIRAGFSRLCRPFIIDVESLDSLVRSMSEKLYL